jgi:hypothetical protein
MCLTTSTNLKIAEEDIQCYKVLLNTDLKSPYFDLPYEFGKVIEPEGESDYSNYKDVFLIGKGFLHSTRLYPTHTLKNVQVGLRRNKRKDTFDVYVCHIPKGAEYYVGECLDGVGYASKKLVVDELFQGR